MKIYLLSTDDGQLGPFSKTEIFAKLNKGNIFPQDAARRESDVEWSTVEEVLKSLPTFFSVEDIDRLQAENPPAPVIIPDNPPKRLQHEEPDPAPKNHRIAVLACVVLAFLSIGAWMFWPGQGETAGSPTVPTSPEITAQKEIAPIASPIAIVSSSNLISSPALSRSNAVPSQKTVDASPSSASIPLPSPSQTAPVQPSKVAAETKMEPPATPSLVTVDHSGVTTRSSTGEPKSSPIRILALPFPAQKNLAKGGPPPASDAPLNTTDAVHAGSDVPAASNTGFGLDFFKLISVDLLNKPDTSEIGVWRFFPVDKGKDGRPVLHPAQFLPCLKIQISVAMNIRSNQTYAKVHFFDEDGKLITTVLAPSPSGPQGLRAAQAQMPVIFHDGDPIPLFFEVPDQLKGKQWKAVVVFGDQYEAHSMCFPNTESDFLLDYPEKTLVDNHSPIRPKRLAAMDPLIQYEVKTLNPKTPKITLFLRPPTGISDASEIKGVLALSILAGNIEEIKREMQQEELPGDYNGLYSFANKHKLAILAWGSTSALWVGKNYDQLTRQQNEEHSKSFDPVADAWERGVHELGEKYGIPQKDFLLWGQCGSAHWAHAICLHKPDYFLAIDIHIPGYFEKPTPEASKVLWCITTGELYGAYQNSLHFVADCKKLGYPIVYKAIVGLGHSGHPDATAMGFQFFEFALSMKDLRDEYDKKMASSIDSSRLPQSTTPTPWPVIFQQPPYYGDMINQDMYPANQVGMIPEGFRIPLPTKEIAAIWSRSK